jgi:methyl-accepting chemotaxis protein
MTEKNNKRHWKNYLIRRDVQLPIIAANLIFLVAVLAVLIVVLLSPLYHDMLHSDDLWVQRASGGLFLILLGRISLAMLLLLVLSVIHQIVLSHRFCGPLVNFGHTFEQMAKGVFSRKVYLRKRDFLKPEAETVNRIIDRLQAEGETLNRTMDRMDETLAAMAGTSPPPETARQIDELTQSIGQCRALVAAWTSPPEDAAGSDGGDQPAL